MDLFSHLPISDNLLPYDGVVMYYGQLWGKVESDQYFDHLLHHIAWKNDEAVMFGKHIVTKRKVAWYGDRAFEYEYSNVKKTAMLWTPVLKMLKEKVEASSQESYNACLLNLYHTGEEGMAWHSDGEKDLKKNGAIASLSFGAERKFSFKHKQTNSIVSLTLAHGSLLVMAGTCQSHWLHRLPPTKKVHGPRINLTFRTIV